MTLHRPTDRFQDAQHLASGTSGEASEHSPLPALSLCVFGLGALGLPVAAAFAAAGHTVWGVDRDPHRQALAAERGLLDGRAIPPANDSVLPPWLVSVLPTEAALEAVLNGSPDRPGALDRLPTHAVHLCIGTIGVAQARTAAAAHAARGQYFIAAPVFGRPDEAWACDLTAVLGPAAGTPAELVETAQRLLACVAPRIHRVDTPAAACAVKLAGNLMIASAIATMTEAFGLAQAQGAPASLVHEVVTGKLFKGPVYEGVGRRVARACTDTRPAEANAACVEAAQMDAAQMAAAQAVIAHTAAGQEASSQTTSARTTAATTTIARAAPGFTLDLGLKDLRLCRDAAWDAQQDAPLAALVQARLQAAVDAGHGQRDWSDLPACLSPAPSVSTPHPSRLVPP